jgi:hypothetical protein
MKIFDWFKAKLKAIYIKPVVATAATATQTPEVKPVSKLSLSILINSQLANGTSANTVQALITDDAGAPIAGTAVNFSVNAGALAQAQVLTDANGLAIASATNTTPGPVTLTASLTDGTTASVSLAFVAVPTYLVPQPAAQPAATPGQEAKNGVNDFDAALKFVESGVGQLGLSAKDELKSLAKKYL